MDSKHSLHYEGSKIINQATVVGRLTWFDGVPSHMWGGSKPTYCEDWTVKSPFNKSFDGLGFCIESCSRMGGDLGLEEPAEIWF